MNPPHREAVEAMVARLEADPRYSYPAADVFANAPLALIQVELRAQVAALRWSLGLTGDDMETSAADAPRVLPKCPRCRGSYDPNKLKRDRCPHCRGRCS